LERDADDVAVQIIARDGESPVGITRSMLPAPNRPHFAERTIKQAQSKDLIDEAK